MRTLADHKINPANDVLEVRVVDAPGSGGANHRYEITGFDSVSNASGACGELSESTTKAVVLFQNGPIAEVGVNGVTHEVLLSILIDRMNGFQAGPYASADNQEALECMTQALVALQRRTRARMARGVEGTHTV